MTNIIKTDTSDIVIHSEYEVYLNYQTLEGKHDFSKCKKVNLQEVDLSKAEIVAWPSEYVKLSYAKGLHGKLDFSNCKYVGLQGVDLSNVKIVDWPSDDIALSYAKGLHGKLDFSKCKEVWLSRVDLSNVEIVGWPSDFVSLSEARGLHGKLDFSKTNKIYINKDTDFSKVSEIIVSDSIKIIFFNGKKYNKITLLEFIEKFDLGDKVKNVDGTPVQKQAQEQTPAQGVKKVKPGNIFQQEAEKLSQGLNLNTAKKINSKGK